MPEPTGAHPTVEVPHWALLSLLDGGRLCSVCLGTSPSWDGHDTGCQGHARQVLRAAVSGDAGSTRTEPGCLDCRRAPDGSWSCMASHPCSGSSDRGEEGAS
jgi:hypothetical protein